MHPAPTVTTPSVLKRDIHQPHDQCRKFKSFTCGTYTTVCYTTLDFFVELSLECLTTRTNHNYTNNIPLMRSCKFGCGCRRNQFCSLEDAGTSFTRWLRCRDPVTNLISCRWRYWSMDSAESYWTEDGRHLWMATFCIRVTISFSPSLKPQSSQSTYSTSLEPGKGRLRYCTRQDADLAATRGP